jgi:hypothetical protein
MTKRYNVTLGSGLEATLEKLAEEAGLSKADILRQALLLYKHAFAADEVLLKTTTAGGEERIKEIVLK